MLEHIGELTWDSVDGFQWSQNPDCPDGCKIDVLKVQRVFHNPEEKNQFSDKN